MRDAGCRGQGAAIGDASILVSKSCCRFLQFPALQNAVDLCVRTVNPQSAVHNPQSIWVVLCALVAGLILSANVAVGEDRHPDAVPVFRCTFGEDWDVNYDGWPDRWVRKTGLGYPNYVNIAIQDDATAVGHKCLRVDLDGAAAEVISPPIRVTSWFSYAFEAQLKNEGLKFSTVVITLSFCDSAGRVLQTEKTEPLTTTKGWLPIQLGPVEPRDPAIDHVVLGLQVVRGNKGDLDGHVSLSDVWIGRLPRIDVTTNNACNVYTELNGVEIQCALSGIREQNPEIDFQLLDGTGKELQREHTRLDGQLIVDDPGRSTEVAEGGARPKGYEGSKKWHPKIPDYGFYRVVVRMNSSASAEGHNDAEKQLARPPVDLVVVPPLAMPRHGEFGWTLPDGDQPLSFQDLSRLLPQVGINWVKLPLWFDASNPRRGDELIRFVELLGASNIDVVGIIDRPPNPASTSGLPRHAASIADVLSQDSSTWSALLEPVMTRLSLRVRWWQLGSDEDLSFAGLQGLNKRIGDLRTVLFRFGQDVRLGMSWDWSSANAQTGNVSWDFEQLCLEKRPTEAKFEELLSMPRANSAKRWVIVEPPPRITDATVNSKDAFEARSTEFVRRLVAAKVHGADAIIVAKPFNDENGLIRSDGMPAELLLPWRTTAAMLGGAKYLGQMQLPAGSENRIFLRGDGQVVMVVWNRTPTREVLYLGDRVQLIDLLGRPTPAALQGREQAIDVGPTPKFVLGLHEAITNWRLSTKFEKKQIPSVFSKPHHNSLHFKNFFSQGVGGSVKIVVVQDHSRNDLPAGAEAAVVSTSLADRWTIEPPRTAFQLAPNAEMKCPFDIKLKDALFGKQPVRVDFTVEADERIEFSVYCNLEIGTEDLKLDVKSHLDKDGTLVVEQLMKNNAANLADFRCSLLAKGHRPQRMQVYRLGKNVDRKVYHFSNGRELVGKELLLELEELNGLRTLKYCFVATAESESSEKGGGTADAGRSPATNTNDKSPKASDGKHAPLASDRS